MAAAGSGRPAGPRGAIVVPGRARRPAFPASSAGRGVAFPQRNDTDAAAARLPPPADSSTRHREERGDRRGTSNHELPDLAGRHVAQGLFAQSPGIHECDDARRRQRRHGADGALHHDVGDPDAVGLTARHLQLGREPSLLDGHRERLHRAQAAGVARGNGDVRRAESSRQQGEGAVRDARRRDPCVRRRSPRRSAGRRRGR